MYTYEKVMLGITKYIDLEILNKIDGWKKWVVGSGISLALANSNNIFDQIKNNNLIKMLDIIDNNNGINVDKIYTEIKKQAEKSPMNISIPLIGNITFNSSDVDKLYEYIKS
jgi:hypothetical protein